MQRFILKTNITTKNQVHQLKTLLDHLAEIKTWSVDMDDIDKVLVVNSEGFSQPRELIKLVASQGIYCAELPD